MDDTSAIAKQIYDAMIMSLSSGERLLMARRMLDTAKTLMISGIQEQMVIPNLRNRACDYSCSLAISAL